MDTSVVSVDESKNDESITEVLASATTASGKKPNKLNASASARSASGSNLKLQAKIENSKKREEEKVTPVSIHFDLKWASVKFEMKRRFVCLGAQGAWEERKGRAAT